jgi:hypothetical protein
MIEQLATGPSSTCGAVTQRPAKQKPSATADRMVTTELPITLTDGKSAEILSSMSVLEELKVGWGCEAFLYAFFTDSLGNMYRAPFPGVKRKLKREGWRLRREHVALTP